MGRSSLFEAAGADLPTRYTAGDYRLTARVLAEAERRLAAQLDLRGFVVVLGQAAARLQTVHRDTNPRFHALLTAFKARTGCPVLVNTSFNVRGEPIVCTPEDAFRCFMGTEIELLVVGDCVLRKEDQRADLRRDYRHAFELD